MKRNDYHIKKNDYHNKTYLKKLRVNRLQYQDGTRGDRVDISIPPAVTPATGGDFSKKVAIGPPAALFQLP